MFSYVLFYMQFTSIFFWVQCFQLSLILNHKDFMWINDKWGMEINLNLPIIYITLEFFVSSCFTAMAIKYFLKRTWMCLVVHETSLSGTEICALCSYKDSKETGTYQEIFVLCWPCCCDLGKPISLCIPNHII